MIKALTGALSQVGIDIGFRSNPCASTRVREVASRIAENPGDASIRAWNLDQDQPGSLSLHVLSQSNKHSAVGQCFLLLGSAG